MASPDGRGGSFPKGVVDPVNYFSYDSVCLFRF